MNESEVKGCEVCKAKCVNDSLNSTIPNKFTVAHSRILTLWFESFGMTGVLFSTIPFRMSANSCDRPSNALPFPLALALCIGMSGGGGGGGGDITAAVVSFAIVSVFGWKIQNLKQIYPTLIALLFPNSHKYTHACKCKCEHAISTKSQFKLNAKNTQTKKWSDFSSVFVGLRKFDELLRNGVTWIWSFRDVLFLPEFLFASSRRQKQRLVRLFEVGKLILFQFFSMNQPGWVFCCLRCWL